MDSCSLESNDLKAIVVSLGGDRHRFESRAQAALKSLGDLSLSASCLTFEAIALCLGDSQAGKKVLRAFHDRVACVMYEALPLGALFTITVLVDEGEGAVRIRDYPVLKGVYDVKLMPYRTRLDQEYRLSFVHSTRCLMCAPVSEWHWATVQYPGGVIIAPV